MVNLSATRLANFHCHSSIHEQKLMLTVKKTCKTLTKKFFPLSSSFFFFFFFRASNLRRRHLKAVQDIWTRVAGTPLAGLACCTSR
jgi:hypothetical protein